MNNTRLHPPGTPRQLRIRNIALSTSIALLLPSLLHSQTWNGGGGDDNWGTGANWVGGSAPSTGTGTQIDFAGSTRLTPFWNYGAFDQMGSILFDSGAGAFTLNGANAMKIFTKIENNSATLQTVSISSIVLNGTTATEINPVSGDLVINSALILDTPQLRIFGNNGKTVTFNGVISNGSATNPSVAINQNSNVVYKKAMTYSGDTFVNAGKLQFDTGGSAVNSSIRIGDTAATAVAAEVDLLPAAGGLTLSNTFNSRAGNSGTATIASQNTSNSNTLSGQIALDKSLTIAQAASGTLNISQARAGGVGTTTGMDIKGNTLKLIGSGSTAGVTGTVNVSGDIYNSTGSGVVTIGGGTTATGVAVTLSGVANTYTGGTNLETNSVLNLNSVGAIGTGALILSGNGTIDNTSGAAKVLTNSNALTLSGGSLTFTGTNGANSNLVFGALTISGAGRTITTSNAASTLTVGAVNDAGGARKLTKAGAGTLLLSAAGGTWTGGADVDAGTLKLGATNAITAGNNVTVAGQGSGTTAILDLAGFNQSVALLTLGGSTTTSGATVTNSSGTSMLTVTGGVTYLATSNPLGATISTSRLDLDGATKTFTVGDSSNAATDLTVSSIIQNGALTKVGTGRMALTGANTFTGTTTISGGTLEAGAAGALGSTSGVAVNTGGTLLLSGAGSNRVNDAATVTLHGQSLAAIALNTGGLAENVGALTLSSNSVIDLGTLNASNVLGFGDSSAIGWTGQLSIWNWSGTPVTGGGLDRVSFTAVDGTALSISQLVKFAFSAEPGPAIWAPRRLSAGRWARSFRCQSRRARRRHSYCSV